MDANALHTSTSPYLQSHADQPVRWHQWGQEAFDLARSRNVPVLVSIGYSTCHWCHVMARESFSDPATAEFLNEHFVAIKVDREELPHVDEYYMNALQALRGQGGWPLTAFTNHSGVPFFAGTYFPAEPGRGLPTFMQVLHAVTNTWRDQQEQISAITAQLDRQLRAVAQSTSATLPEGELANIAAGEAAPVPQEELTAWCEQLSDRFDPMYGGFGSAPKFPPSMVLRALLQWAQGAGELADDALRIVRTTVRHITAGGMRDQLRGGIARYSTDQQWHVPHFEKMLNDNALYLSVVTAWWTVENARDPHSSHAARAHAEVVATVRFLLTDMRLPGGGLATALDADSPLGDDSVEGAFYTFTAEQVGRALAGEDLHDYFALVEFPHSGDENGEPRHALIAPGRLTDAAGGDAVPRVIDRLRAVQDTRTPPKRDDKFMTEDACLAATALIRAGAVFDEPEWVRAGAEVVAQILSTNRAGETLLRSSTSGRPGPSRAGLADYAALIRALVELHQIQALGYRDLLDAEPWALATDLFSSMRAQFLADGHVTDYAPDPLVPASGANPLDSVVPCGRTAAAEVAQLMAAVSPEYQTLANELLTMGRPLLQSAPTATGWQAYVAMRAGTPVRVSTDDPELARVAYVHPCAPFVDPEGAESRSAIVCVGTRCLQPARDVRTLREQLDELSS